MIGKTEQFFSVDRKKSWIIGDRSSDIRAGFNAGCAGGIHLRTEHGIRGTEQSASLALNAKNFIIKSLPSIAETLTELPLFKQHLH